MTQLVKNLPAMWETWVRTLGWEDPLEKGKATHSGVLAWRILWSLVYSVLKWGKDSSHVTGLLQGLNEIMHLAPFLAHSTHSK